ncbi:hypothetical protein ACH4C2_23765 [Streptomyces sp. NPDC018057]
MAEDPGRGDLPLSDLPLPGHGRLPVAEVRTARPEQSRSGGGSGEPS